MREAVREFVRLEACDAITHIERWALWVDRDCALLADDPVAPLVDVGGAMAESFREVRRGVVALGECLKDLESVSVTDEADKRAHVEARACNANVNAPTDRPSEADGYRWLRCDRCDGTGCIDDGLCYACEGLGGWFASPDVFLIPIERLS